MRVGYELAKRIAGGRAAAASEPMSAEAALQLALEFEGASDGM